MVFGYIAQPWRGRPGCGAPDWVYRSPPGPHTQVCPYAGLRGCTYFSKTIKAGLDSTVAAATSETKRRAADEIRARRAKAALGVGSIKHVLDFAVEAQAEPFVDRQRVPRDQVGLHVAVEDVERVEGRERERR